MWSFRPRMLIHRQALYQQISTAPGISGVTLLGGEPLQQPANTLWLLQQLRSESSLSLVLYTGYTRKELQDKQLLGSLERSCDLIITGRYEQALRDIHLQWRGSTNQELIYPANSRIQTAPRAVNEVELIIDQSGTLTILGYPDEELLA